MTMNLSFLGAAGTVTGSKYLVENGGNRVLFEKVRAGAFECEQVFDFAAQIHIVRAGFF